jgi:thiol:disulfide interchange protein
MGVLILLVLIGFLQRSDRRGTWLVVPLILAGVGLSVASVPAAVRTTGAIGGAGSWSEARVADARQKGRPVFVYFTADWCLSCKVNEATSIDREEVRNAFKKAGVMVLAGDWTDGDPAITRFLENRGRAGVPLYLWYAPGKEPEELPQLLTPEMLISRARAVNR